MPATEYLRPLRVALYSHDTQGLGHIRRSLAIASSLVHGARPPAVLLVSGTHVAGALDLPPGVDMVTLPGLTKNLEGDYQARGLPVTLDEIIQLRGRIITSALSTFAPDVLVVDKAPAGACGELLPALATLKAQGRTRCVLGLRDILDDHATTRREWVGSNTDALIRDYYDGVWVYGDPAVFDPVAEYGFAPDIAAMVRYTGYLNRMQYQAARARQMARRHTRRLAFCQVGGGQDGFALAHAFAQAKLPEPMDGLLLTGPFMPQAERRELKRLTSGRSDMRLLEFVPNPIDLLQRADRVIAMGGYNTTCEILSHRKQALIVPRVRPRLEQLIRAERLSGMGLLDLLHPDDLTPGRLSAWLEEPADPVRTGRHEVDLNGMQRLPHLLRELTAQPEPSRWSRSLAYASFIRSSCGDTNHV